MSNQTKIQIQADYEALCREVGDLYFQLSHAEAQYTALKGRMEQMVKRRNDLHTALKEAISRESESAVGDTAGS